MQKLRSITRRKGERGSTVIEFGLCTIFLVPLLLGTFTVGMNLTRNIQCTTVTRDVGQMYVRNTDFTLTANRNMAVYMSAGLGITATGGNGVMVMSQITKITDVDCTGANLTGTNCTNRGEPVFKHRVTIGNTSLRASAFGTPPIGWVNSDGSISATNYMRQNTLRANGFESVLSLNPLASETAYVMESYFSSPDYSTPGFLPSPGVYTRQIY
jgi:hypothetical protein